MSRCLYRWFRRRCFKHTTKLIVVVLYALSIGSILLLNGCMIPKHLYLSWPNDRCLIEKFSCSNRSFFLPRSFIPSECMRSILPKISHLNAARLYRNFSSVRPSTIVIIIIIVATLIAAMVFKMKKSIEFTYSSSTVAICILFLFFVCCFTVEMRIFTFDRARDHRHDVSLPHGPRQHSYDWT